MSKPDWRACVAGAVAASALFLSASALAQFTGSPPATGVRPDVQAAINACLAGNLSACNQLLQAAKYSCSNNEPGACENVHKLTQHIQNLQGGNRPPRVPRDEGSMVGGQRPGYDFCGDPEYAAELRAMGRCGGPRQ